MEKKKSKKGNPNFLSWIVDPAKGLFSPILKGIPEALVSAVPLPTADFLSAIDPAAIGFTVEVAKKYFNPDIPKSSGELQAWINDIAGTSDLGAGTLLTASTILSAIPFASIGDAVDEVWRVPTFQAIMDMGVEAHLAAYNYGLKNLVIRHFNKQYQALLPEAYRLADMAAKGLMGDETYYGAMAENGLPADWALRYKQAQHIFPDIGTLLALWRRDIIEKSDVDSALNRMGYTPNYVAPILWLKDVIPPLQDLIRMAVREAFGSHTYEEQMPALKSWGAKMGLTNEWVENYWYAHWERIPLREMYSNLWRGYWTEAQFNRMLRIKDVHPDDRKAILDVAYLPPSIREMGYGYDMGVYDRADIVRYRKWGGMSPPDAEKAADSLIRYRVSAEIEAVRREWLWQFANGKIEIEEYMQALLDLDTPEEALQYWYDRGLLQRERFLKPVQDFEGRITSSAEAKWAFKNGVRDETWLRLSLAELDWTPERIDLTVERLKIEVAEVEKKAIKPVREMTVSDLRAAFRYEIIDEVAFRLELEKRNYAAEDIDLITLLELYRRPVPPTEKIPEITYSQLAGLFRRAIIDETEFRVELAERKYTQEDIDRLVADEILKGIVPPPEVTYRDLTVSQIVNMFKAGMTDELTMLLRIEGLGYTSEDAQALATLYTITTPEIVTAKPLTATDIGHLYDMGIYDVGDVINGYEELGYSPENAVNLTVYLQVAINFPDLKAMYSKGWITADVMFSELVSYGLTDERASELVMTAVKAEQPERLAAEKDLTKSEIVKGVKNMVITAEQAVGLLMDLGYDEDEAWYILLINKVVEAGDPQGYYDMKRVVEAYKKMRGMSYVEIPQDVLSLELSVRQQELRIRELEESKAEVEQIAAAKAALSRMKQELTRLLSAKSLH